MYVTTIHRSFYRLWNSRHDLCVQSVVRLYICMNVGIDGSSFFKGPQCLLNSTRLVDRAARLPAHEFV